MRLLLPTLLIALIVLAPAESRAGDLPSCREKYGLKDVELLPKPGTDFADLKDRAELSGVGYLGEDTLVVVSNEAIGDPAQSRLQVFRRDGDRFVHDYDRPVFARSREGSTCRSDIEGLAVMDGQVFVTPSFSLGRKKPKVKAAFERNDLYGKCAAQKWVLRLGHVTAETSITRERRILDIAAAVGAFDVLKPFAGIPSKENGIDIEGLAVTRDKIYLGLRGPVLDPKLTPIIVAERANTARRELRYVDLGGLGIRDIAAMGEDGFLLIAGPVGRIKGPFVLYSWTGKDGFPGASPDKPASPLCALDSGAEGVAARPLAEGGYELAVVFDDDVMKAQIGRLPRATVLSTAGAK